MDAHIPRGITNSLRLNGIDVLTAQEDGSGDLPDPQVLDRARTLRRAVFTFDDDLLALAAKRQRDNTPFAGVIYAHPLRVSVGACIRDLVIIAKTATPEDLNNRVEFLPL